jgi:hypothetical protein
MRPFGLGSWFVTIGCRGLQRSEAALPESLIIPYWFELIRKPAA